MPNVTPALLGYIATWNVRGAQPLPRQPVEAALPAELAECFPEPPDAKKCLSRVRDYGARFLPRPTDVAASMGEDPEGVRWTWSRHTVAELPDGWRAATSLRLDHPDGGGRGAHPVAVVGVDADNGALLIRAPNGTPVPFAVEWALREAWHFFEGAIVPGDLSTFVEAVCMAVGGKSLPKASSARWVPPSGAATLEALEAVLRGLGADVVGLFEVNPDEGSRGRAQVTEASLLWIDTQVASFITRVTEDEAKDAYMSSGNAPKGTRGVGQRPARYAEKMETFLQEAQHLMSVLQFSLVTPLAKTVRGLQERCANIMGADVDELLAAQDDPAQAALVDLDEAPF